MQVYALTAWIGVSIICPVLSRAPTIDDFTRGSKMAYIQNPAPDKHRCGVCPTYFQKICAFNVGTNATFIFDNHCIMDLYNCIKGTAFTPLRYDHCMFFGNFAYVHGFKHEDLDYGEDHFILKDTKKNPDFVF